MSILGNPPGAVIVNEHSKVMRSEENFYRGDGRQQPPAYPIGASVVGRVFTSKNSVLIRDTREDLPIRTQNFQGLQTRSLACKRPPIGSPPA